MKHLVMAGVVVMLLLAGGAARAEGGSGDALRLAQAGDASALKKKPVKECGAEENGCNNRPEAPKTRGLKTKTMKECPAEENTCNNRPEVPKTRGLKKKGSKKECDENSCN